MAISDYLRGLRARIGPDLIVMPSVGVLVFDDAGDLLLVHHADTGVWAPPGGSIDPFELPAATAVRETAEETGLAVRIVRLVGVCAGRALHVRYPNGDEVSYVGVLFEARVLGGSLRPDGEETLAARFTSARERSGLSLAPWLPDVLDHIENRPGVPYFDVPAGP